MKGKILDPKLCDFVRHLDDDDIQWLLEAPTLVPELMGLTEHLPTCQECGERVKRILIAAGRKQQAAQSRPMPLVLAASSAEADPGGDPLVCFDSVTIGAEWVEFLEDEEGRVWLRGSVPRGVEHIVFGSAQYHLRQSSVRPELEVCGIGSIDVEDLIARHEAAPEKFSVHFA